VDIQLHYDASQDRIRLTLPRDGSDYSWWLTRRLSLKMLPGFVGRLTAVPLPPAPKSSWAPSPTALNIAQQHSLLMEYDGPRSEPAGRGHDDASVIAAAGDTDPMTRLVIAAHLKLRPDGCSLRLQATEGELSLNLNRQQLHSFLEALAKLCRTARWTEATVLPDWLGALEVAGR